MKNAPIKTTTHVTRLLPCPGAASRHRTRIACPTRHENTIRTSEHQNFHGDDFVDKPFGTCTTMYICAAHSSQHQQPASCCCYPAGKLHSALHLLLLTSQSGTGEETKPPPLDPSRALQFEQSIRSHDSQKTFHCTFKKKHRTSILQSQILR